MDILCHIPEDERDATWVQEMLATAEARGRAATEPAPAAAPPTPSTEQLDDSMDPEEAFWESETDGEVSWDEDDLLSSTIIGTCQYLCIHACSMEHNVRKYCKSYRSISLLAGEEEPYLEERSLARRLDEMSFLVDQTLELERSLLCSTVCHEGMLFEGLWLPAPSTIPDDTKYLTFYVGVEMMSSSFTSTKVDWY